MDLVYMKRVRIFLNFLGSWPYKVFGENKKPLPFRNNKVLFIVWLYVFLGGILYLKKNQGVLSFFELGQIYISVFMNAIGLQRSTMISTKKYRELTKEFVDRVHLFHHKHKSPHFKEMNDRVDRLCHVFPVIVQMQIMGCTILYNIVPIFNNYNTGMYSSNRPENKTFEHSFYYVTPFNIDRNIYTYLIAAILNVIMVYDCGSCFCVFDLYLSVIIFHLWGHIKVLECHLRHFPLPRGLEHNIHHVGFTPEENLEVSKMLIDYINHHRMLKDFMNQMSGAFGPMLGLYYVFHQLAGCIYLLECSRLDTASLIRYGPLTVIMTQQLAQVSIVVECLGARNECLDAAVYSIPWEHMSVRNQRAVGLFLMTVQVPRRIKAMGMVPVGVCTMAAILKTSLSYFMLLRTFATDS